MAWLAAPIVLGLLALVVLGWRLFMNRLSPVVDRRHRDRDDNYFLESCHSGALSRFRWINRHVPSSPRCKFCLAPFGGLGRIAGIKPSRKNPNYCRGCFEMAPLGGADMEVGILFADLRGFTSWCEGRPPEEVARVLNQFYEIVLEVVTKREGLIDKLVGDEVMGLFLPAFPTLRDRTCDVMIDAAQTIMSRADWLPATSGSLAVGIGLHFGMARVGNVGAGEVKDFTALGETVNFASRLQGAAGPGEILMSAAVHERTRGFLSGRRPTILSVKGIADPITAYSITSAR